MDYQLVQLETKYVDTLNPIITMINVIIIKYLICMIIIIIVLADFNNIFLRNYVGLRVNYVHWKSMILLTNIIFFVVYSGNKTLKNYELSYYLGTGMINDINIAALATLLYLQRSFAN